MIELRNNRLVGDPKLTIGGLTLPLSRWCKQFNRTASAVRDRFIAGLPDVVIVFGLNKNGRKPRSESFIRIGEVELSIADWARLTNQRCSQIEQRVRAGADPVESIFG